MTDGYTIWDGMRILHSGMGGGGVGVAGIVYLAWEAQLEMSYEIDDIAAAAHTQSTKHRTTA